MIDQDCALTGKPAPPRRRKIAILLPTLHFGGAERASLTLAKALQERGVEVDILLMQKAGEFLSDVGSLNVIDLKCRRTYQLPAALLRYLLAKHSDVVICNFWKLNLCASFVRLVYPFFKLMLWEHAKPSNTPVHSPQLYGFTSSLFYQFSSCIVAVSNAVRDDILMLTKRLDSRIVVINNPIPPPSDTVNLQSADFVFVGRLDPQKNPMLALEAFARVARRVAATFAFIGDGMLRQILEERAAELGLSSRVRFLGFVPEPATYMRTAKVLVLTSDAEGFGNVLVEALYCGLGIVSTDCGGPSDVIGDHRYGRLVPVGDVSAVAQAMIEELDERRDPLVQKGRALDFSPDRVAELFLQAAER